MGMNYHHLPGEVAEEILLRLPIKTLRRFKCVCKSWYALISNRSFANNHLNFNKKVSQSSTSLFLNYSEYTFTCYTRVKGLIAISNDDDDDDNDDGKDDNDSIPCIFEDLNLSSILATLGIDDRWISRSCHCNGIIFQTFLKPEGEATIFYNPAIKDLKALPIRSFPHGVQDATIGFGCDPKANDYKYVRILNSLKTKEYMAEVYTLGSDCWKQIKIDIEFDGEPSSWDLAVHCKGVYFWLMRWRLRVHSILSFDMSDDKFRKIPLPDNMLRENGRQHLVVWNESVAVLFCPDRMLRPYELWVLDSHLSGVKRPSWTKHLTIGPLVGFGSPLMFWKSDELLLSADNQQLVSYNLGTHKLRKLPCGEICWLPSGIWLVDFYTQSLVPVNRGN